jgi:hypothetical protein
LRGKCRMKGPWSANKVKIEGKVSHEGFMEHEQGEN